MKNNKAKVKKKRKNDKLLDNEMVICQSIQRTESTI